MYYLFDQPGYAGTLKVFDTEGRMIRKLANNELLGTEGAFNWDGTGDHGRQLRRGMYFLFFEVTHPEGKVERYKEVCVLGG